jgi:hypothetical protein
MIGCGEVQDVGPTFAVADILTGLGFVARHDPHILARANGGLQHAVVTVSVAHPDLPTLLAELEPGAIQDPVTLVGEEVAHGVVQLRKV